MPRRALATAILILLLAAPYARAGSHGEEVYRNVCSACHIESMTPERVRRADEMLGPPMNFMTTHLRQKVGNDKAAFVRHVVEFTMNPSRDKAMAMPRALQRFGLMPSLQTIAPQLDRSDVRAVAEWMWQRYDYEKQLDLLDRHHGPGGMGHGRGAGGAAN
jgi:cytochrome c5